jgi:hypothetical protein
MADEWRVSEDDQPLVIDYDLTYGWSYPRRLLILFINILYLFESWVVMISAPLCPDNYMFILMKSSSIDYFRVE